ncbi:MAG TPA: EF-hand domain-containing protein [Burkholderiales bacterium]|nr:EF-hand domain-containing protein [Burkholderiales bacterium]
MFALSRFEWLVLAVALLLCPGFSWSQARLEAGAGATAPAASLFDRLDRNKDGYLTRDELTSDEAKSRNWIAVDRDRDGRISRAEFGLVGVPSAAPQPSAAAGATTPPKPE